VEVRVRSTLRVGGATEEVAESCLLRKLNTMAVCVMCSLLLSVRDGVQFVSYSSVIRR
jgi:hypothetical protein